MSTFHAHAHLSEHGETDDRKDLNMSIDTTATQGSGPGNALLTIDEAASYLAIPKATLYTWRTRRAGFGPRAVKIGGCLRFRQSDLDAWIEDHVEAPHEGDADEQPGVGEPSLRGKAPNPGAGVPLTRRRAPHTRS